MPNRVLLAGLFHETHTFLEGTTPLDHWQVRRGPELLTARGDGSPLSGVIEVAEDRGWQLLPAADLRAMPGPTATDDVLEVFWSEVCGTIERELPRGIDGVFLVLHGAMVTESCLDPEGEVVGRLRALPGLEDVPLCGVLDLHGNISPRTIEKTQGLVAYRCNPHIDAREAAVRGALLLDRILADGRRPVGVWAQPPVIWPPTGTGTDDDPLRTLERLARQIEAGEPDIAAVNVMAGYSYADTPHTGVAFAATTFGDPAAARRRLDELCTWTMEHRKLGCPRDLPLEDAMPEIAARAAKGEGPILIVEPADNIGGGAPGDGTSVLRALLAYTVKNAAVAINDPAAVARLGSVPVGGRVRLAIGGRGSRLAEGPVELEVELLFTSDGKFTLEDPHSHLASMHGHHIDMGPSAVVRHGGVRILLTTHKTPPFDLGQFRSQGIEPEKLAVVGVKAAVAHRRAYDPIAKASYTVATPGPCASDLTGFPYRHVRRPVFPLDVPP